MDLQYISETSLALTEYVSGYVTKAEKSNVQDIWNDISNSDSVYKRLFHFSMGRMRSKEVGLYEASDKLLGDHLREKSAPVPWIGADMPHKRKRMFMNHSELKAMAAKNPNTEEICDPPREKVLGAKLNYSVWCRKVNFEYFVENQFFAQSNYSIYKYKLPFDTKLVVLLLVGPEIELLDHWAILVYRALNTAQLWR